ncbi:hypothetical protein C8F01DRAFT_1119458 [Mycena amicta]|nr:hypothetical protein C8F01DRAFT_1119458 [Mycena amicta]
MRTSTNFLVQQVAPLAVLLGIPILALGLLSFLRPRLSRFYSLVMALGALLPWNWGTHVKETSSSLSHSRAGSHGKKTRVRTRADQIAESKKPAHEESSEADDSDVVHPQDALFPGLVNMSGTHCFMNSTLQALASLSSLSPYLLSIRTRAESLDVPTPVVDTLIDLLDSLNTPAPSGRPLRATELVEALCSPPPAMDDPPNTPPPSAASALSAFWGSGSSNLNLGASTKATALLASHEHQDAQELFQLLSECVREDNARVTKEAARDRGFAFAATVNTSLQTSLTSPFDGLTATRRSCVRCGYTAAIRHFAFDTIQLPLESAGGGWGGTSIYHLLRAYTSLEVLQDCACRRCEMRATARRLREEVVRLESASVPSPGGMLVDATMPIPNGHVNGDAQESDEEEDAGSKKKKKKHKVEGTGPTPSRLRRIKAVRKMEARVLRALETGRIEEEELEGDWDWETKTDGDATFVHGAGVDALKGVKIERVPGGVSTRQSMIGRPPTVLALHINRSVHTGMRVAKNGATVAFPEILDLTPYTTDGVLSLEPTAALSGNGGGAGVLGALSAGVTMEGRPTATPCLYRLAAAVCHYGQHSFGHYICYRRMPTTPVSGSDKYVPASPTAKSTAGTGTGWLRISDARVDRCGVEQVLAEGSAVFMLYYEHITPASESEPEPSTMPIPSPSSLLSLPQVYTGDAEAADSAETIRPLHIVDGVGVSSSSSSIKSFGSISGLAATGPARARVVRSVMLGSSSRASGSVSSLGRRKCKCVLRTTTRKLLLSNWCLRVSRRWRWRRK